MGLSIIYTRGKGKLTVVSDELPRNKVKQTLQAGIAFAKTKTNGSKQAAKEQRTWTVRQLCSKYEKDDRKQLSCEGTISDCAGRRSRRPKAAR